MTVAALFVRKTTHYSELGCECYDADRDALSWQGGSPGIFHPPCRAWSNLSHMAKPRDGERELAVWAMAMVRRHGGVVEHPYNSRLWCESGCGSFGVRDSHGGVLIPAMQAWFGHRALKKSAFYVVGPVPELPEPDTSSVSTTVERMGRAERERTPFDLAVWLVRVAEACR